MTRGALGPLLLLLAAGCAGAPAPASRTDTTAVAPAAAWVDSLPKERRGVLLIEGTPETTTFRREVTGVAAFYVPADMEVEHGPSALWIHTAFPGQIRSGDVEVLIGDTLAGGPAGWHRRPERLHPWTVKEYVRSPNAAGQFGERLIGTHAGRPFVITATYPREMADGMGPRFKSVLDSWIWTDTRRPLEEAPPDSG